MKKILLTIAATMMMCGAYAQNDDPVVMEVGGQQIRQSEFMKEFLPTVKRHGEASPQLSAAEKRAALTEYADLYATFRAKILDARALGLDTNAGLRFELRKYRNDLALPYLTDSAALEGLLREAYDRNHYSVHAAQILVRLGADAAPEDTVEALALIKSYRDRIDAGEDFMLLAAEEFRRVNPGARQRPNEGDLGYFTAFDMVYPFETAAYNLEIGEVSQPVRTRFGYHLVKLIDKVPLQGKLSVAHIWLSCSDSNSKRQNIYSIYEHLRNGVSFEEMAMTSDDHTTANNGGEIPTASLSQLPPEYIHAVATLSDGEFSRPFFTKYGWHIVKLIHKDSLPPYSSMVPYYKQKMSVDPRGAASRHMFCEKARAKYGIRDLTRTPVDTKPAKRGRKAAAPVMQASIDRVVAAFPDTAFRTAQWAVSADMFPQPQTLITVPGCEYNELQFAGYISRHLKNQRPEERSFFVNRMYEAYLDSATLVYADSRLEDEHPDFAEVVEEYRRGLMIFNYNDKMIWTKAVRDTLGFADFYRRESATKRLDRAEDSIYFWRQRARVAVLTVADSAQLQPAKAQKVLDKALKKNLGGNDMKQLLEKNFRKNAPATPVALATDLVERTRQQLLADDQWSRGVYLSPEGKGYRAVVVIQLLEPTLKSRSEARGYYLNLYQNEVERNLIQELHRKYNVKINWDVVEKISF